MQSVCQSLLCSLCTAENGAAEKQSYVLTQAVPGDVSGHRPEPACQRLTVGWGQMHLCVRCQPVEGISGYWSPAMHLLFSSLCSPEHHGQQLSWAFSTHFRHQDFLRSFPASRQTC